MGIRTNTLGKSAIVDMQLNKAYDVVEYVALNLPLIAELSKKLSLVTSTDEVASHISNTAIHLSQEEKDFLTTITSSGFATPEELGELLTQIKAIKATLTSHINSDDIHLSKSQIEAITRFQTKEGNIPNSTLSTLAYTGSYKDLKDIPEIGIAIDDTLSTTSSNPVENRVITEKVESIETSVSKKLSYTDVARVALTGSYYNLVDAPVVADTVTSIDPNPVSSKAVYKAIQDNLPETVEPLSNRDIDMIIGG